jgi:hypothetical protein
MEEWSLSSVAGVVRDARRIHRATNEEMLRGIANMALHHHELFFEMRGEFIAYCMKIATAAAKTHERWRTTYRTAHDETTALRAALHEHQDANRRHLDNQLLMRAEISDLIRDLRAANQREATMLNAFGRDSAILTLRQQVRELEVEVAEQRLRFSTLPPEMRRDAAQRAVNAAVSPQQSPTHGRSAAGSPTSPTDRAAASLEPAPHDHADGNQAHPSTLRSLSSAPAQDDDSAAVAGSPTHQFTTTVGSPLLAQQQASSQSMASTIPTYSRQHERSLVKLYKDQQDEMQTRYRQELAERRDKYDSERSSELQRLQDLVKQLDEDLRTKAQRGGENQRRLQQKLRDLDQQMKQHQRQLQAAGAGGQLQSVPSFRSAADSEMNAEQVNFWTERDRQWRDVADLSHQMHTAHAELILESTALANKLKALAYIFETRPTLIRSLHELFKVISVVVKTIETQRKQAIDRQPTRKEAITRCDELTIETDVCREGCRWIIANLFTASELQHLGASPCHFEPDVRRPTWRDIKVPARMYAYIRPTEAEGSSGAPSPTSAGRVQHQPSHRSVSPSQGLRSAPAGATTSASERFMRTGSRDQAALNATVTAPQPLMDTLESPSPAPHMPPHATDAMMPRLPMQYLRSGGVPPPPRHISRTAAPAGTRTQTPPASSNRSGAHSGRPANPPRGGPPTRDS